MNQPDRIPLKTITKTGIYVLRLSKPKAEKVRVWDDGTMSARLFLMDKDGNCLSASYGTKYPKALAMMVGKLSGKYTSEFAGQTVEDYIKYVEPAVGHPVETLVEVKEGEPYDGRQQYKYKLSWAKKGQTLSIPDTF